MPAPIPPDLELTILMPCLDEAVTLPACIAAAQRYIREARLSAEIVVADNGSTDGSADVARQLGARVVEVPLRGYGAALYHGSRAARGRFVIMGDADCSYDFLALAPFVEKLREGFDLVVGNRFRGGIGPGAMPWKNRFIGNPILSALGRTLFGSPVGDFHCGLRGYRREAFERMDLRTTGMEFASEMVLKATLLGMKVSEVPTTLSKDGRDRPPHLRPWRDGWRHLRFMLLYSPRWLFLYPGLALLVLGGAVGGWLWTGPKRVGGVELDVHTLLYAAMLLPMGFQLVSFAVFSKVFAIQEGLVPPDPRLERLFRWVTLEVGLACGALLTLVGLAGSIAAVGEWGRAGFGGLDPSQKMRLVIPSATALILGLQTVFSSFLLSVLGLRIRRLEGPE